MKNNKKLVVATIALLVAVSAILVVHNNRTRGYKTRQEYYDKFLSKDPMELAGFLDRMGMLDEFVMVDEENWQETRQRAAMLFVENEEIHQQALKVAKDYINWQDSLTSQDIERMVVEQRLARDPKELAEFLDYIDKLDEFVEVDEENRQGACERATSLFIEDEVIHQQAIKVAQDSLTDQDVENMLH